MAKSARIDQEEYTEGHLIFGKSSVCEIVSNGERQVGQMQVEKGNLQLE